MIHIQASQIINAAPAHVYGILSDYHEGHQRILPRPPFEEMSVESGGVGAGTITRIRVRAWGTVRTYHHVVTEPEPGRVLQESDKDSGQYSQFTVDPVDDGQHSRVTIDIHFPIEPGIAGIIQRLIQRAVTRRILEEELRNLDAYAQRQQHTAVTT